MKEGSEADVSVPDVSEGSGGVDQFQMEWKSVFTVPPYCLVCTSAPQAQREKIT